MRGKTRVRVLCLILIMGASLAACGGRAADSQLCDAQGKLSAGSPVAAYYLRHGGEEVFGCAITRPVQRGDMYVQYFEKAVLRYPVNDPRYDEIELVPLGMEKSAPTEAETPQEDPDCRYFERHGHFVCLAFLDFYDRIRGERVIGEPIGEAKLLNGSPVQDFENARLRWVTEPGPPHVELESWGEQACLTDRMLCYYEDAEDRVLGTISSPIDEFVGSLGREAILGYEVSPPVQRENLIYQCYQNACLVLDPRAAELVSLVPLGLQSVPRHARIGHTLSSDEDLYFSRGDNPVVLAFREFYFRNGGGAVFGWPLTDQIRNGEFWVQWFENVCFEWHPDRPDGERVQLTPLGEINYRQFRGELPPIITRADEAQDDVVLRMALDHSIASPEIPQIVNLRAEDSAGRPLPGIIITLYIATPESRQIYLAPATDANGHVRVTLGDLSEACGEIVRLRAVMEGANTLPLAYGQFIFWCSPNP